MSYLSKLEIDYETAARRQFHDLYRWHQASWDLFPNRPDANRQFLTRLDAIEGGFRLYVLSTIKPVKPEWCAEDGFMAKEISPSFLNHSCYRFDLRVNPTKKVKSFKGNGEEKKNGKRVALLGETEQLEWLKRKGQQCGFEVLDNPATHIDTAFQNHFSIPKIKMSGLHFGVRFTGLLKVSSRGMFERAFMEGIGSAKGFGFGLLLLKPVVL